MKARTIALTLVLVGCSSFGDAPMPPGAIMEERSQVTEHGATAAVWSTPITGEFSFDFETVEGGKGTIRYHFNPPVDSPYRDMTYEGTVPDYEPLEGHSDGFLEMGTGLWYVRFGSEFYGPYEGIEGDPVISADGKHVAFVARFARGMITSVSPYLVIDGERSKIYGKITDLVATGGADFEAQACEYKSSGETCVTLRNFEVAP